jgi:hypothetical protein
MSGDTGKAGKSYEAFLALWNEADSNLKVLQDARLEYSRLPGAQHPKEPSPVSTR